MDKTIMYILKYVLKDKINLPLEKFKMKDFLHFCNIYFKLKQGIYMKYFKEKSFPLLIRALAIRTHSVFKNLSGHAGASV